MQRGGARWSGSQRCSGKSRPRNSPASASRPSLTRLVSALLAASQPSSVCRRTPLRTPTPRAVPSGPLARPFKWCSTTRRGTTTATTTVSSLAAKTTFAGCTPSSFSFALSPRKRGARHGSLSPGLIQTSTTSLPSRTAVWRTTAALRPRGWWCQAHVVTLWCGSTTAHPAAMARRGEPMVRLPIWTAAAYTAAAAWRGAPRSGLRISGCGLVRSRRCAPHLVTPPPPQTRRPKKKTCNLCGQKRTLRPAPLTPTEVRPKWSCKPSSQLAWSPDVAPWRVHQKPQNRIIVFFHFFL
mmetsp:Transcript_35928/g.94201  ORF Transcript_35928/g.94201 Transcript_35928/m.94201 type:complete len:296 (+) Transcript_35928:488-1375(+)